METASAAPARPPARPVRAVLVVLALALGGFVAWKALLAPPPAPEPGGVWDYIRDRVVEGDGEAPWRMMLPEARPKFLAFVKQNAEAPDSDARAAEWRKKVGLSREDLKTLPPEKVMAREYLASVDRIRGSRVFRTDEWPGDRALIRVSLKDGGDVHFVLRRTEGAWKIEDLVPMVTNEGNYIPYPGAAPVKVPVPK